jgi:hypothetical protein
LAMHRTLLQSALLSASSSSPSSSASSSLGLVSSKIMHSHQPPQPSVIKSLRPPAIKPVATAQSRSTKLRAMAAAAAAAAADEEANGSSRPNSRMGLPPKPTALASSSSSSRRGGSSESSSGGEAPLHLHFSATQSFDETVTSERLSASFSSFLAASPQHQSRAQQFQPLQQSTMLRASTPSLVKPALDQVDLSLLNAVFSVLFTGMENESEGDAPAANVASAALSATLNGAATTSAGVSLSSSVSGPLSPTRSVTANMSKTGAGSASPHSMQQRRPISGSGFGASSSPLRGFSAPAGLLAHSSSAAQSSSSSSLSSSSSFASSSSSSSSSAVPASFATDLSYSWRLIAQRETLQSANARLAAAEAANLTAADAQLAITYRLVSEACGRCTLCQMSR